MSGYIISDQVTIPDTLLGSAAADFQILYRDSVGDVGALTVPVGQYVTRDGGGLTTETNPTDSHCYDAIVDGAGGGDYTTIGAAITGGAATIFIQSGTYSESSDIVLPQGGCLIGNSGGTVDIHLTNGARIVLDGQVRRISTGTISVSNDSTAVTGSGTTFTTMVAGDYILLNGVLYPIQSVTDNTNLVLSNSYQGRAISSEAFIATSVFTGMCLQGFRVMRVAGAAAANIYCRGLVSSYITNVASVNGSPNLDLIDCGSTTVHGLISYSAADAGICVRHCFGLLLSSVSCSNSAGYGILLDNESTPSSSGPESYNVLVSNCQVLNGDTHGIEVTQDVTYVIIDQTISSNNTGKGIDTLSGSGQVRVCDSTLLNNGSDGIDFDGLKNSVVNCYISGNGGNGIRAGDDGVMNSNHISYNSLHGIELSGDTYCTITGNNIHHNSQSGIYANSSSLETCITSNMIQHNTLHGVHIDGSDHNTVTANQISHNSIHGVFLEDNSSDCNNNIISSNQIAANTNTGIECDSGNNECIFIGNIMRGNGTNSDINGSGHVTANNIET